ncbi:hypothetical protein VNO77_24346 [Canavalia gladiata]|uniref:Uncharacterized protein n=1 Tax=Canavalia gladiata TaxID=3824 RepID=A0AAN9L644_CANGL
MFYLMPTLVVANLFPSLSHVGFAYWLRLSSLISIHFSLSPLQLCSIIASSYSVHAFHMLFFANFGKPDMVAQGNQGLDVYLGHLNTLTKPHLIILTYQPTLTKLRAEVGVAYTLTPISNWFEKLLVEIHSLIQEGNSYSACLTKD